MCDADMCAEEVKMSINKLKNNNAPGPDGLIPDLINKIPRPSAQTIN